MNDSCYVPILKWRQGEYLALEHLDSQIKDKVLPLIEIPPIEWDFENNKKAKTIDKHLEPFPNRLDKKWNNRKAFLDLNFIDPTISMSDGSHPVFYIFNNVSRINKKIIPVTGLDRNKSYQQAIKKIVHINNNGICIRLKFKDIVKNSLGISVESMVRYFGVHFRDVDIVLDLEAPNYNPLTQFVRVFRNAIKNLPHINKARSLTIASTNFPPSMGNLKQGVNIEQRAEWLFYLEYCFQMGANEIKPNFGDYAIAHPKLLQLDMRTVTPAASLRYTVDNAWYIHKGTNVRRNGFGQYEDICRKLTISKYFLGESYSKGDTRIKDCSTGQASTGNLTLWRWVGTNHHITKVVRDCANCPYA